MAAPFEGDGLVNCYLIDAPSRALIDTGTSSVPGRVLLPALRELGWDPSDLRLIINTHMHIDHAGGNAEMQEVSGAGIHMHRADYALADREAHVEKYCRADLRLLGQDADIPQREALAVWQAIDSAGHEVVARKPGIAFPDLYRQVVRKVAPSLDNDPDAQGALPGSVATIAAHRARAA